MQHPYYAQAHIPRTPEHQTRSPPRTGALPSAHRGYPNYNPRSTSPVSPIHRSAYHQHEYYAYPTSAVSSGSARTVISMAPSPMPQGYPAQVGPARFRRTHSHRKRQLSLAEYGGFDEYENREEKRRKSHSEMERERRRKTNLIIEELRDILPGLKEQKNLHKLNIFEATLAFVKKHMQECNERVHDSIDRDVAQSRRTSIAGSGINMAGGSESSPSVSDGSPDTPEPELSGSAPCSPSKSSIEFLTG